MLNSQLVGHLGFAVLTTQVNYSILGTQTNHPKPPISAESTTLVIRPNHD